ncbi:MAG: hypothetical protein ACQERS_04350 [Bacteroidota bacterium]
MYLGMKQVMKQHDANAISINCLGVFTGAIENDDLKDQAYALADQMGWTIVEEA